MTTASTGATEDPGAILRAARVKFPGRDMTVGPIGHLAAEMITLGEDRAQGDFQLGGHEFSRYAPAGRNESLPKSSAFAIVSFVEQ